MNARRLTLALALVTFGVATDRILRGLPGIGLFLLACGGVLLVVGFARPKPWGVALLGAALFLMSFALIRANPFLLAFDLLAAATVTVLAASFARSGDPVTTQIRAWIARGVKVLTSLPEGVRSVLPPLQRPNARTATVVLRTAVIAGVAALLFGGILMSADPVFAQIVTRPLRALPDVNTFVDHAVMIVFATLAAGTVVAYARRTVTMTSAGPVDLGFQLGGGEWATVVAVVAILFAGFVAVQFPALFGGHTRVLDEIGLTYSEYARSGFLQMIVAAMLTLGLLAIAWTSGAAASRTFRLGGIALIGLDLVVLLSAFRRLALYEQAFGWTFLRLFGHVFILWLAVVLVFVGVALALRGVRWLPFAALAAALVALIAVNVLNPDAFIATHNIERDGDQPVDVSYLAGLSEDAVPAVVAVLPTLGTAQQATLIESYRGSPACAEADASWLSWNLSRERAQEAFAPYC